LLESLQILKVVSKKNVPVGNFRYDYACYVGEYMKFSFCKENFGEEHPDFSKNELFDSKV
jgi:hypothetical protein